MTAASKADRHPCMFQGQETDGEQAQVGISVLGRITVGWRYYVLSRGQGSRPLPEGTVDRGLKETREEPGKELPRAEELQVKDFETRAWGVGGGDWSGGAWLGQRAHWR